MSELTLKQLEFFKEAILSVSSSLDLSEAMVGAFEFLKAHFPLEGLSLHRLSPQRQSLHLMFLVTQDAFHYLDELVPLHDTDIKRLLGQERQLQTTNIPNSTQGPVTSRHSMAISPYLEHKDRGYLVAILSVKDKAVGHLCLIGSQTACFHDEHRRKLDLLIPAFSLMMMNLLQYRQVIKLQEQLIREKRYLAEKVRHLSDHRIIGAQGGLRNVMDMVAQLSGRDVPVLITGETGTGKELIANAIHRVSARHEAPYIKVNCGAIPDTLIDSELFGHEKGSFTGATSRRVGRFEQADGGTLFLDEIGDMPLQVQTRLLRVLQNGIVERVGGTHSIMVNVRIIAATHRNLSAMVRSNAFREDLFYRLNVFPIQVPPLRERIQDIPALLHHFIHRKSQQLQLTSTPHISADSIPKLSTYHWPGNVRELENLVERALIQNPTGPLILHHCLPSDIQPQITFTDPDAYPADHSGWAPPPKSLIASDGGYMQGTKPWQLLVDVIADHIRQALERSHGKINGPGGAADLLGVNPNTLRKRMDKLNIPYGHKRLRQY